MIYGQDWSAYQSSTPDLKGLDFAFVKITEGMTYTNPKWVAQRDHAKKAGLVWGGYHYPHMANDPVKEADRFLGMVAWQPGDIIVLDWEGYDAVNTTVPKSRQIEYRDAWLKYVKGKMSQHQVGMYCNVDYWKKVDTSGNCGDFLWIATGGRQAADPGIAYQWTFHQYSTANNLDHNVANFPNRAALAKWAGNATTSSPGDKMTISAADAKQIWKTDDFMPAGSTEKNSANKYWTPQSFLTGSFENTVQLLAQTRSNGNQLSALAAKVDKIALGGIDLDALATKVADLLAERLKA